MIFEAVLLAALASATPNAADPPEPQNTDSRRLTEGCGQTTSGERCDIVLRHRATPERSTHTTDYECRGGFRYRLIYEELSTRWGLSFFQISVTTLRPERFAIVSATDGERISNRFDGANIADIRLVSCGLYEGTAEIFVTYFRMDWSNVRTIRYAVRADGHVDDGEEVFLASPTVGP